MKSYTMLVLLIVGVIVQLIPDSLATTEPVCSYKNSQGETVFLKYLPLLKKGEDYVDFDKTGKCVKRAVCNDHFVTDVDDCTKYSVTCKNKSNFNGVFPACCVKCGN